MAPDSAPYHLGEERAERHGPVTPIVGPVEGLPGSLAERGGRGEQALQRGHGAVHVAVGHHLADPSRTTVRATSEVAGPMTSASNFKEHQ